MDIEEAKRKKTELETKIRDLIVEFFQDTGLIINRINHEMVDASMMGHKEECVCTAVILDVEL